MRYADTTTVTELAKPTLDDNCRYLYCIADAGQRMSLERIGIDGKEVYTIPYKDICAVLHKCPPSPYQSDDVHLVQTWVTAHSRVIDAAWAMWGTVLPLTFNTLVRGDKEESADLKVKHWLERQYDELRRKIEKVIGKAEYGVQVFWNEKLVSRNIVTTNPELRALFEEIKTKSKGLAYMYRQRLENLISREMEAKADECFKDFYNRIRKCVDSVHVEKTRKTEQGLQMIMNLSCLVHQDKYSGLGEEMDKINRLEGFSVRFTGPWPPYGFVGGA